MCRRLPLLLLLFGLLGGPVQGAGLRFDGERAFELLVEQVEMGPRAPGLPGHAAQLRWMRAFLAERADRLDVHSFQLPDPYGDGPLRLTNLRAVFRPEASRRVALAAHWDTRPRADRDSAAVASTPIPGANDGASGVAVLLHLAELLAEHPPTVGVDLLFFDGEDYGLEGEHQHYLLGSRRFVRDHPQYRPQALILLDMVGDADLRIPMEGYSLRQAPQLVRRVFERAAALGLPAFAPVEGRAVIDDHLPFLEAGIPAVDLIDFDYPPWHTLGDLPAACSPHSLQQVGELLVALLYLDFAG